MAIGCAIGSAVVNGNGNDSLWMRIICFITFSSMTGVYVLMVGALRTPRERGVCLCKAGPQGLRALGSTRNVFTW